MSSSWYMVRKSPIMRRSGMTAAMPYIGAMPSFTHLGSFRTRSVHSSRSCRQQPSLEITDTQVIRDQPPEPSLLPRKPMLTLAVARDSPREPMPDVLLSSTMHFKQLLLNQKGCNRMIPPAASSSCETEEIRPEHAEGAACLQIMQNAATQPGLSCSAGGVCATPQTISQL